MKEKIFQIVRSDLPREMLKRFQNTGQIEDDMIYSSKIHSPENKILIFQEKELGAAELSMIIFNLINLEI
jgi:hypothetical protein